MALDGYLVSLPFVLSLGMGAPLLLVGAGISKLPKAGGHLKS
jgi:thiol:disulfide interchange protein